MDQRRRSTLLLTRIVPLALLWLLAAGPARAGDTDRADELLSPGEAFVLEASRPDASLLRFSWRIAPGYYLYRDRFRFHDGAGARIPNARLPEGLAKDDPYFGPTRIYRGQVVLELPLNAPLSGQNPVAVRITSQGCADLGVCFPPQRVTLALATGEQVRAPAVAAAGGPAAPDRRGDPLGALLGDGTDTESGALPFIRVANNAALDRLLARARRAGAPAMLDFYADWCVPCREMEAQTLTAPPVRDALADTLLLRADVSASTPEDLALLKRFGLEGPPAVLFFDRAGEERAAERVTGFMAPAPFAQRVRRATR